MHWCLLQMLPFCNQTPIQKIHFPRAFRVIKSISNKLPACLPARPTSRRYVYTSQSVVDSIRRLTKFRMILLIEIDIVYYLPLLAA